MDKSKMAKAGVTIKYDPFKGGCCHDQMSRPVKQRCGDWCCCEDCKCEKSLDDTLNPPDEDDGIQVCCGGV